MLSFCWLSGKPSLFMRLLKGFRCVVEICSVKQRNLLRFHVARCKVLCQALPALLQVFFTSVRSWRSSGPIRYCGFFSLKSPRHSHSSINNYFENCTRSFWSLLHVASLPVQALSFFHFLSCLVFGLQGFHEQCL